MSIIRWDPLGELDNFIQHVRTPFLSSNFLATNVYEKDNSLVVDVSLPGIQPDKVDVTLEGENLRIAVNEQEEEEKTKEHYYLKELTRASGERIIHLPEPVVPDKVNAVFKHGILTITMPRQERSEQARKIKIEGAA